MRQLRMIRGERIDACPICNGRISDLGFTHINSKEGHLKYETAKCLACNVRLTDTDGKWKTSWLEYHQLDTNIDMELAKNIYEVHEFNNQKLAAEYGLSMAEYNEMAQNMWDDFLDKMKSDDKLFTWKADGRHGLAIVRNGFVIGLHQFDR